MSLAVRRVSPVEDREEMLDVLKRNWGEAAIQEQRFAWRHTDNPAGVCWSWFLYDRKTRATVAMATVFPRHMRVGGKRVIGGQVGEFAVNASHRSLGPAVLMQRTTFRPVECGAMALCYDCPPHDRGMSTFVRLGMAPNCQMTRYALPLRSDEYLRKKIGSGVWTKPMVAIANLLIKVRLPRRGRNHFEISEYDKLFDEEFSRLDEIALTSGVVRASRAAEDLNWRYRQDPLAAKRSIDGNTGRNRVLVARDRGELMAFAVFFVQRDGVASLVDLFGQQLSTAGPSLLEAVIEICRREKASSLHAFCSDESQLRPLFQRLGFHPRERNARVVGYSKPDQKTGRRLDFGMQWTFSQIEVML